MRALPSVIQRLWDQELRDTGVTLILVGSSISMMEEATLLGNSPLYGRFTEKIDLRQLDFAAARTFFPSRAIPPNNCSSRGRVWWDAVLSGWRYMDNDLGTVIQQSLLSRQGFLHDEPEYVLRTELTEPNRYFAILKAIAAGTRHRMKSRKRSGSMANRFRRTRRNWSDCDWSNERYR